MRRPFAGANVRRGWPPLLAVFASLVLTACNGVPGATDDPAEPTNANPTTAEPLSGGAQAPSANATSSPSRARGLLPDLEVMPIRELYVDGEGDGRVLRFSTSVLNSGVGPLELVGSYDLGTNAFIAAQRTYWTDGSVREQEVGEFRFRAQHAHWHFEDFTVFEVWTHDDDGALDDLVLSTGKTTFCAVDEVPELASAPPPAYLTCGEGLQGISAGWSDTYAALIPGQELALGALPDGNYALRTAIDPAGRLSETDKDNNASVEYVRIDGSTIVPVTRE